MAENRQGITIDFYGNTIEFDKSIDGVNKALKTTKSELSTLNKELKLDPKNVELLGKQFNNLKQQQSLLSQSVEMYKSRLAELGDYNNLTKEQQKEFEAISKALGKAQVELDALNKRLSSMPSAKVQELAKEFEDIGNKLNKIGDRLENVGKKFMALTGVITGLATVGVKYNADLERQTALFTTLTGSAEEANEILNEIKENAKTSPFDAQSLITANQYLISTGIEAENSMQTINALGDAISATGGGNSELQRMAQNLQQVQNVGKASSVDMKQFAMAGIDIWGILSESTGKTVAELQEMDITFDMINDALIMASQEGGKYYGAMSAQSETLNGKISMLKATFQELLGELTEMLVPIIKQVLDYVQDWVNRLKNLDDYQKETITKIGLIVASIAPLLTIVGKLIGSSGLGGLFTTISTFLKSESFVGWITKVAEAGGGLKGVLSLLGKALTSTTGIIGIAVTAFVLLYTKSETFRNAINNLVKTLASILKPILDVIIGIINTLVKVLGGVASVIVSVVDVALKGWIEIISAVINVITSLINLIKQLFEKLKDTTFGQAFINVLEGIGNVVKKITGFITDLLTALGLLNNRSSNLDGRVVRSYSLADWESGRIRSGGIGITANINVENNGKPIDRAEIRSWVNQISQEVDKELGRWV